MTHSTLITAQHFS